jgi:polar amino acid transport system substrate-binding protein
MGYAVPTRTPFFRLYLNLYTYADHPKEDLIRTVGSVEDLKRLDLVMVSNLGNGWHQTHIEEQGVTTQWVPGDEQIVRFLALKRADGMIEVAPSMNHLIEKMGMASQLVQTDVTFGPIDFHIMVSKKSPFASRINEIETALKKLQENGTFQQLWSKYN